MGGELILIVQLNSDFVVFCGMYCHVYFFLFCVFICEISLCMCLTRLGNPFTQFVPIYELTTIQVIGMLICKKIIMNKR